jgi:hypothetical protein
MEATGHLLDDPGFIRRGDRVYLVLGTFGLKSDTSKILFGATSLVKIDRRGRREMKRSRERYITSSS